MSVWQTIYKQSYLKTNFCIYSFFQQSQVYRYTQHLIFYNQENFQSILDNHRQCQDLVEVNSSVFWRESPKKGDRLSLLPFLQQCPTLEKEKSEGLFSLTLAILGTLIQYSDQHLAPLPPSPSIIRERQHHLTSCLSQKRKSYQISFNITPFKYLFKFYCFRILIPHPNPNCHRRAKQLYMAELGLN